MTGICRNTGLDRMMDIYEYLYSITQYPKRKALLSFSQITKEKALLRIVRKKLPAADL